MLSPMELYQFQYILAFKELIWNFTIHKYQFRENPIAQFHEVTTQHNALHIASRTQSCSHKDPFQSLSKRLSLKFHFQYSHMALNIVIWNKNHVPILTISPCIRSSAAPYVLCKFSYTFGQLQRPSLIDSANDWSTYKSKFHLILCALRLQSYQP